MRLLVSRTDYEYIRDCLLEVFPEVKVDVISEDYNLYKLGFVDSPPCEIEIVASKKKIEEILDYCIDLEVSVFNVGPNGNVDPYSDAYKNYERFERLFNLLSD